MQIDSYSAFYDNGHLSQTMLHHLLTTRNIATVYIVGLATDYCVFYTASDANTLGLTLADRTNGRAYATVLRPSVVRHLSVCDVCIVAKRCVLEEKLLLTAYMRNRLVPK